MRCRASLFNALHGDGLGPTSLRSCSRLRVWPSWDGQSLIVLADLNAIMCLMSAADDLNLLGTGLRDRTSSLATAARGALEAASYAAFLAGPGISPAERARRSLNEVLHSTHENVLTYRMVGLSRLPRRRTTGTGSSRQARSDPSSGRSTRVMTSEPHASARSPRSRTWLSLC